MTHRALVSEVAAKFELDITSIGTAQKGYRNESHRLILTSGENVNLIFHKNEHDSLERIRAANQASSSLKDTYPIRTRFDKRTLKLSDGTKEVYAAMYTYLPGSTIPWEAYAKDHIKLLGWAMSDMHAVWRLSGATKIKSITEELHLLLDRMESYFLSPNIKKAVADKLQLSVSVAFQDYEKLFKKLDTLGDSEKHTLHMDLVRGNVLFATNTESLWQIDGLSISGIIDFEKAATGHRVFDIARTLAFLLVDCANKNRSDIHKYFLQSGYNKRGKSSFRQNDIIVGLPADKVLNTLVGFFLLHDFYKFLKHTPYESLESNHHFIRTRDILIDYGMLRLDKD